MSREDLPTAAPVPPTADDDPLTTAWRLLCSNEVLAGGDSCCSSAAFSPQQLQRALDELHDSLEAVLDEVVENSLQLQSDLPDFSEAVIQYLCVDDGPHAKARRNRLRRDASLL
uniref:Uncharacterized protein n=1 Tax=Emiliania huxleyi TaxID=2903 RepID=A0A7S3RRZ7_EMIHU|mmetsp:Transcript_35476/g.105207  ORF Transcript_35476/g.105207 Transcript_35476/m.105207 type:complete len:114 (+) Transcript_35476:40-381(+)